MKEELEEGFSLAVSGVIEGDTRAHIVPVAPPVLFRASLSQVEVSSLCGETFTPMISVGKDSGCYACALNLTKLLTDIINGVDGLNDKEELS